MEDKTPVVPESPKEISCPNCDTVYTGNFCPHCGQSNSTYDKPLRFIVADFAGNIFAFDTRLWNTLKTIFIHPGKMAQEIMEGKRARYMPPFRLYVFVSFIFFLMLSYWVSSIKEFDNLDTSINFNLVDSNLTTQDSIDLRMAMDSLKNNVFVGLGSDSLAIQDSVSITQAMDSLRIDSVLASNKVEIFGDSYEIDIQDMIAHPKRYYSQFFRWVSTAMFFLMPIYGLLLWLFFRKTLTHYFGHLILAINQHVFTFLLFIILMLIDFVFPNNQSSIGTWLMLCIPIYYFLGAHRLYQRRWSTTLMRLMVIGFFYNIVIAGALILSFGMTIFK